MLAIILITVLIVLVRSVGTGARWSDSAARTVPHSN
jgi:hypothetical protein